MSDATPASALATRLSELIEGFWATQVIRAAAQLKLRDLLDAEFMLPEELARRADAAGGKRARALFAGSSLYRAFENLPDMVRTGRRLPPRYSLPTTRASPHNRLASLHKEEGRWAKHSERDPWRNPPLPCRRRWTRWLTG